MGTAIGRRRTVELTSPRRLPSSDTRRRGESTTRPDGRGRLGGERRAAWDGWVSTNENRPEGRCRRTVDAVQSGRRDLNPRPPEPHSGALPGCATSRPPANHGCRAEVEYSELARARQPAFQPSPFQRHSSTLPAQPVSLRRQEVARRNASDGQRVAGVRSEARQRPATAIQDLSKRVCGHATSSRAAVGDSHARTASAHTSINRGTSSPQPRYRRDSPLR